MVFQITNSCNMLCPHCMDSCVPCDQHMSIETFRKAVLFAHNVGVRVLCVSGGEPSHNPAFDIMLRTCAETFLLVTFISNGEWIGTDKERAILLILRDHPNVKVQITSVKGIYRLHEETIKKVSDFKLRLRNLGLKNRLFLATAIESMLALGRATEHAEFMDAARRNPYTMSCFASALISAQLPFMEAIDKLETMGKFCHPLVDWKGDIHWSESVLCPHFANVGEDYREIMRKGHEWRPCCKCADYQKLTAKTDVKYVTGRQILGI